MVMMLALLFMATAAFAQDKPKDGAAPSTPAPAAEQKKAKMIWDYEKELGLTKDQVEQLKKAAQVEYEEIVIFVRRQNNERAELGELLGKNADLDRIKFKLNEIYRLQAEIEYTRIRASVKYKAILKPDQLKKWQELQKKESEQNK
jgi:Spy/CpxP family protein refolding chaperone